jgi:EAL domain-containing protein (putative c-di-GMP-specific phosphodiesterase class I)
MLDEKGKLILPSQFLGIAERFGLIHEIDRWVVCKSIRLVEKLQQNGKPTCLEVNLSGKSLMDTELLPLIKRELAAANVDPVNLIFEITETSCIENIATAQNFISSLKNLGCHFALDDFGIGFSSFNYLKHLPVDCLKIDGSFIHNLSRDSVDQQIVRAIVEVARGLGKKTIAEFVEDGETVNLLREFGVNYAQGYHIGKPHVMFEI